MRRPAGFLGASPVQILRAGAGLVMFVRGMQLITETAQELVGKPVGELGSGPPAPRALSDLPVCGDYFDDVQSGATFTCRCPPGHAQPHVSWRDGHTPERFWTRLDNGKIEQVLVAESRPW